MDFTTIKNSLETFASNTVTYVAAVGSQVYNGPIIATVQKIWEVSGPANFVTAALPALGSAGLAHKLFILDVSYKDNSVAYLAIKTAALVALVASGMFTAAFAATAFGATGTVFYASGFVLPAAVLLASR